MQVNNSVQIQQKAESSEREKISKMEKGVQEEAMREASSVVEPAVWYADGKLHKDYPIE